VRSGGAVPATIAIIGGEPHIGLDDAALRCIAEGDTVVKVSVRDVAVLAARGGDGATTVASTAHLAAAVGIVVFATGGLGGVHRGARDSWDESADLMTLSRTGVLVVCAGVKSILDVGATLERLESLNVAVIGYRTDRFPGFYLADSGHPVSWRVSTPQQVADVLRARRRLGTDGYGLVLANPIAPGDQMDHALHDRVLAAALRAADADGVQGKDVTPFLLEFFHRETRGASLAANVALVLSNARLAAEVAAAYAVKM
jgi:pseudouridine-5'-phosphate glycosidase